MGKKDRKKNIAKPATGVPAPAPETTGRLSRTKFLDRIQAPGFLFLLGVAPLVFFRTSGEFENNPKMAFLQWGISILALSQALE
jgi:hypothetical protein